MKEAIALWRGGESHKQNIATTYTLFLRMQGKIWNSPLFHVNRKLPFIQPEKELDALIAGTGRKTSVYLQTLKETAMRYGECSRLKWEDLDLQRRDITLNEAEKNGNPRIFSINETLANMLSTLRRKTEYVFGSNSKTARSSAFYNERRRIAHKLGNLKILKNWIANLQTLESHHAIPTNPRHNPSQRIFRTQNSRHNPALRSNRKNSSEMNLKTSM